MQERYQRSNGSWGVRTVNNEPSKTDQSMKKQCDVNYIMSRYTRGGEITHLAKQAGQYIDATKCMGLFDGLLSLHIAQSKFERLNAEVKNRFKDMEHLVQFLSDPANEAEAITLGLVKAGEVKHPVDTPQGGQSELPTATNPNP